MFPSNFPVIEGETKAKYSNYTTKIITYVCLLSHQQLQTPEYICFINRHSSELARSNSISSTPPTLPTWKQHKRKAPPPRVKSMDELMLEESMRRNSRKSKASTIPDLRVNGNNAPGYQVSYSVYDHGNAGMNVQGLRYVTWKLVFKKTFAVMVQHGTG